MALFRVFLLLLMSACDKRSSTSFPQTFIYFYTHKPPLASISSTSKNQPRYSSHRRYAKATPTMSTRDHSSSPPPILSGLMPAGSNFASRPATPDVGPAASSTTTTNQEERVASPATAAQQQVLENNLAPLNASDENLAVARATHTGSFFSKAFLSIHTSLTRVSQTKISLLPQPSILVRFGLEAFQSI